MSDTTTIDRDVLDRAAAPLRAAVAACRTEQLGDVTPCPEWDVRGLVNHMMFWIPVLATSAGKEPSDVSPDDEKTADLVQPGWQATLTADVDRAVAGWGEPGAWEGTTSMTGAMELPASMVGSMLMCELVLHGWDLARGIGQQPRWDDDVLARLHDLFAAFADQGRAMGAFGPEVPVAGDAPMHDRLLGLAGRDPAWSA